MDSKNFNNSFPDFNIPDSQKGEDYHKQVVMAICNNSLHNTYDLSYASMNECYDFYNGTNTGDEFKFLQEAEDGDVLPAYWINYNKIKVRVDIMLGELSEMGYDVDVRSINKEAVARKTDAKETSRVEMRVMKDIAPIQEESGMQLVPSNRFVPNNEDELNAYFDHKYREQSEKIVRGALKYSLRKADWDYERFSLFRDVLIAGRCFVKVEMLNGVPVARRVDPRFMIFDTNATNDFLSDSTFFGEVRYMSVGDAADQYNVSAKEIMEVYKSFDSSKKYSHHPATNTAKHLLNNTSLKFFKKERGELRVMVLSAVWQDIKKLKYKESMDSHGYIHVKKVGDRKTSKVKTVSVKAWRQATLIGGEIIKEWGEIDNMVRDYDNLHDTRCPYKAYIPNYINGLGVSKVEQLKGLQKLKDITMYNIQLTMARAGAKGFFYDVSQVPQGWEVEQVVKYLKTVGIAFIDSKKDGLPSNFNQFSAIDMTLSNSVQQYLNISFMIDKEMDAISGVNEARQGIVRNSSQAVGVTQSSLFQSNMATKPLFEGFNKFSQFVFDHMAGLVKVKWPENKSTYAPIIGEVGINFLEQEVDIDLDDYATFVEAIPQILTDINILHELVKAALSSGKIGFIDAIKLLKERDINTALDAFDRTMKEMEQKLQQQQQMEAQQMQQMQMQQQEAEMQKQQMDYASELEKERLKGQIDLQNELAKIRANAIKDIRLR